MNLPNKLYSDYNTESRQFHKLFNGCFFVTHVTGKDAGKLSRDLKARFGEDLRAEQLV